MRVAELKRAGKAYSLIKKLKKSKRGNRTHSSFDISVLFGYQVIIQEMYNAFSLLPAF